MTLVILKGIDFTTGNMFSFFLGAQKQMEEELGSERKILKLRVASDANHRQCEALGPRAKKALLSARPLIVLFLFFSRRRFSIHNTRSSSH